MIERYLDFRRGESFHSVLSRHRGMGPSFDLLRFTLALLLLVGHTRWIGGGQSIGAMIAVAGSAGVTDVVQEAAHFTGVTKPIVRSLVPAFFALSGFLVVGSAFRLRSTSAFLAHRALRIFPALAVEVTLSALLLGALLSTLPWKEYFTHPAFFRYFGNMIGWIVFTLPGVFESNPVTSIVNINLWTLPAEFYCYLIIAALLLTGAIFNRTFCAVAFVGVTIGLAAAHYLVDFSAARGPFPSHVITYYFFVGVMFYHYREIIPMRFDLFLVALGVSYAALMFDSMTYIAPLPLTYCTLFFGLARLPKIKLLSTGDYSYGIYLYGFPIAQMLLAVFPQLNGNPNLLVVLTSLATLAFAVTSWHLIEKRALSLKHLIGRRPASTLTEASNS